MPKLHFGSRGGVYYREKGRKIYVNRFGSGEDDYSFKKVTNKEEHQKIADVYDKICNYNGEVLNFNGWLDVDFTYNILGKKSNDVYINNFNLFYIEKDGEVKAFSSVDTFLNEGKVFLDFICSQDKSGFGEKLIKRIMKYYGDGGYSFLILEALNEKLNNYYVKFDPILREKTINGDRFYYKIGKNVKNEFIKNLILIYLNITGLSSVCDDINGYGNHKYFFKELEFKNTEQFIEDVLKKYDEINYDKKDDYCKKMFIKDRTELFNIVKKMVNSEVSSSVNL